MIHFGLLKPYILLFYLPSSTALTSHSFPYKITLHFLQSGQLYSAILLYPLHTFFYIYIYPPFLMVPAFHFPDNITCISIFSSLLPSNFLSCQWYSFTISANFTISVPVGYISTPEGLELGARFFPNTSLWPVMSLLRNL